MPDRTAYTTIRPPSAGRCDGPGQTPVAKPTTTSRRQVRESADVNCPSRRQAVHTVELTNDRSSTTHVLLQSKVTEMVKDVARERVGHVVLNGRATGHVAPAGGPSIRAAPGAAD
jgi:hypothetical protein